LAWRHSTQLETLDGAVPALAAKTAILNVDDFALTARAVLFEAVSVVSMEVVSANLDVQVIQPVVLVLR